MKEVRIVVGMSLSTPQISETIHPSIHPVFIGCYHVPGSVLGSGDTVSEADVDFAVVKLAFRLVYTLFTKFAQIMLV